MPDKVIVLNEGPPWGFRMTGGKNTASPLKISRVNNAGKAAKSGVREGFLIETINSATVDHLTSSEAQALIRNSGDTLTIGVYRQPKSNSIGRNDHGHETGEAKALVDKNGRSKQSAAAEDAGTTSKKSKRVRKRRRKKKPVEQLDDCRPKALPATAASCTVIEQQNPPAIAVATTTTECAKIEIVPANSDLRVDELEWIERNEALLIAELETRRRAGLPVQVVVRVEKVTPSAPAAEYCRIVPDFCHLDVIREETSASDEDRVNRESGATPAPSPDGETVSLADRSEPPMQDRRLERLESPSLVRGSSEILRFADVITTTVVDECAVQSATLVPPSDEENDERGTSDFECETRDDVDVDARKTIEIRPLNNGEEQRNGSMLRDDECARENAEVRESPHVMCQLVDFARSCETSKVYRPEDGDVESSSDDETVVPPCDDRKAYRARGILREKRVVSVTERLKEIARSLREDTDDYEELAQSQTSSARVSMTSAADADVDTDWVSFTLSDDGGESSKSLCLSPSQSRSSCAPSTVTETSEIIDLHRKFLSRTKSSSVCTDSQREVRVDILGYDKRCPSPPKSLRYTSEVVDEACRMCGTSDEPLSDAECLVSLRRYRETRSRLLDVIQREQRRDDHRSSVIGRRPCAPPPPPPPPTTTTTTMPMTFIDTLSVPDRHTRQLMYAEYMEKVKERENRLHNKVIRITKPCGRPLSSSSSSLSSFADIDAEFLSKARQRLEKLGVRTNGNIEVNDDRDYYPRHLVDIVPEEEVCIEEVHMNGVWSPELKHKSLDSEDAVRRVESSRQPSEQLPPVWTPNSSPTPDRKAAYKPVRFESPTLSRKKITVTADATKKTPPKPPIDLPALSTPPPPPPPPSPPSPPSPSAFHRSAATSKKQSDENAHNSTDRRLPRVQSPTVTLLQKAREGQLPKGSAYLDSDDYNNMDKENKTRRSTAKRNVNTDEMKYASRREYDSQSDEKKQKKMVEISPKKYEGIGPTTKEGVPIVLRSEIKEPNQPKWYKQMYESLHKFQSDEPRARNGDGYLSEPEKGYESDFGENRLFQNVDGEYTKNGSVRRPISPVKCGQDRYKNQPRPIENYEPGHSSIAEKETKQFWDDVINAFDENSEHQIPPRQNNRLSSKKSNLAQALKESGYDSDSTLVFKRRENQSQCLSPTEQKTAYKVIQNGGEVPFQGLRKTVPDRPKDSSHKYAESEVTLQYRRPVRNEIKVEWSEEDLAVKQAEAMRRIYQEERRRKYLQELQDMSNRRHADNLLPSQKSPIPLNRYDDFLDESPQPPRSRTPEPKLVARALYNFVGQTSRELSFRKGDIIFVRKQIDKNWYEGEHNAMVGLFPFNYVEVIPYDGVRTTPHRPYEGQARAKFNFMAQTNMELSLVKGELVVLTRRVDNNWYEGRIGSRKGIFPVSYVTVLVEPSDHPNSTVSSTPFKPVASPAAHSLITSNPPKTQHMYQPDSYNSSTPTRNSGTQTKKQTNSVSETLHVDVHSEPMPYRALYNYKPQNSDELELREGDVVFVMEKCDDGWYVGSSKRTGCFGTFPGNYVQRSV